MSAVERFSGERGWLWRFFPAQALLMLGVFAVTLTWGWAEGRELSWREVLMVLAVTQAIGVLASTVVVLVNLRRPDVVYMISPNAISCEVDGRVIHSVDPAQVSTWMFDDRLYRWWDHLLLGWSRLQFRGDGPRLHVWSHANFGVAETTFAPLVLFDRENYAAILVAVENATGVAEGAFVKRAQSRRAP